MKDGPNISGIAALLGDPARGNMLAALMNGQALTASELAHEAGVAASTASGHLSKLESAGLVVTRRQGRHRYFHLSGHDVAHVLEALDGLAARVGHTRARPGPKDEALRQARVCYDHLAGTRGVKSARKPESQESHRRQRRRARRNGSGRADADPLRHRLRGIEGDTAAAMPRLPRLERAPQPPVGGAWCRHPAERLRQGLGAARKGKPRGDLLAPRRAGLRADLWDAILKSAYVDAR